MGICRQVICTAIACYTCMCLGVAFAWPSSTLTIFASTDTILNRPMTTTEISLFGSLSSIGALISTPIAGFCLDIVGRKYCALFSILTHVICWTILATSYTVEWVLTAIFISGIGGAAALVIPVYVGEICQEHIRGTMTGGSMIFYAVGMLVSYVTGGCLEYKTMVYMCLTMAVLGIGLMMIPRETPTYLMKKGMEAEAAKSLAFYRNVPVDSKEVFDAMDKLRRAFDADLEGDNISPEEQKLSPEEKPSALKLKSPKEKVSLWRFVRKSRSTRQAMIVTLTLITAAIFQGLVVLQVYAQMIFEQTSHVMSTTVALVIFSVVTIVTGFIAAWLTDVAGRRNLMIYASLAAGFCCVGLGTQLHIHWAPDWVTLVFIYLFTATYTFGAGTVPFILVAEVFLPEVKSFMSMFVMEWAWLCNFVILFIFNPLVQAVGFGPTFYLFASICFFSALYAFVYLPETKGLSVDRIQTLFLKSKAF